MHTKQALTLLLIGIATLAFAGAGAAAFVGNSPLMSGLLLVAIVSAITTTQLK